MTTPTPGKHASQVGATPPVSTPFSHLTALSPRGGKAGSVMASPQQMKKSPANSSTVYGHPTHSSVGGGATSAPNFDSPSAAAALGGGPAGLHVLGDLQLDGAGASTVPLHGVGRGDEGEQRRRLQHIVDMLKVNQGHVSEEGLERLAKRVGLESLWEPSAAATGKTGTLILAGSAMALDIHLENDLVTRVEPSFPDASKIVSNHTDKAAQILLEDLKIGPGESPLTKTLEKFADNLERLAALDKLSVIPGLNCHEAVSGIYESLRKLFDWELAELKRNPVVHGQPIRSPENYIVCRKSGRPAMHMKDKVGMSLEYWNDEAIKRVKRKDDTSSWSIVVECAPLTGIVFPSVRVSDAWISPNIRKEDLSAEDLLSTTDGPVLNWLEPDNTILPSENKGENAMEGIEQPPRYPDVMFMARFNPPVVVPYSIGAHIHGITGAPFDNFTTSTFDGLLLPPGPDERVDHGEPRAVKRRVNVKDRVDDKFVDRQVRCTLFIEKVDYGRSLTELPFSHPRQLVEILPTLRQYAFVSRLLHSCFGPSNEPPTPNVALPPTNKRDDLAAFMGQVLDADGDAMLSIDVSITIQPMPHIQILFPLRSTTANVIFEVGANAAVTVVSQNIFSDDGAATKKLKTPADLAKLLELCEDLAVFVTYVRGNL